MSGSPAFQFYPDDFLGSGKVGMMDAKEIGVYIMLLCLDWNDNGFQFDPNNSDDLTRLARWCHVDEGWLKGGWQMVGRCFVQRGERWFNPRLDDERKKQAKWREKSRQGGIKSGRARVSASKGGIKMVDRVVEPKGNTPFPSPSPITTTSTTTWLTPVCDRWESRNGAGSFASVAGQAAKALSPLKKAGHEVEEMARRLAVYLDANEPRFWSLVRFAQTFDQWRAPPTARNGGARNDAVLADWLAEKEAAKSTGGKNGQ